MTPRDATSWDVFISHASEDKDSIARPLALRLQREGLRVWLDEQELILGDSLRQKIDHGLSASRWGVVILSPSFLAKEWPQAELDALLSKELNGQRVLLPVWHRISADELSRASPILASRLAIDTRRGLEAVSHAILAAVNPSSPNHRTDTTTAGQARNFTSIWFEEDPHDVWYEARQPHGSLVGATVDRYVLREFIGFGGTGMVFRAHHRSFGREVALKIFRPIPAAYHVLTKATERAVRGLGAIRDRRIVSILDYGCLRQGDRTAPFLAYDYIRGVNLHAWASALQQSESFWERILGTAIEVASALGVAHKTVFVGDLGFQEAGVLHADIKPSNILVEEASDAPVILDFMIPDLQRLLHNEHSRYSRWEKNSNGAYQYNSPTTGEFGTPGFMPPEQELDGVVSPASDVYALGQTFIRTFWPTRQESEFPNRWITARSGAAGQFQQRLAQLLDKMVELQPARRIQTMEEVAAELRNVKDRGIV